MGGRKKVPSKKRSREPKGSASKKEPTAKKAKKDEPKEEGPAVEYKTVPCKKYWTVGHCELGPKCVYIHQEVSDAMAKQIVANNGELPPSVALSVAIKPIPKVGAKNIQALPNIQTLPKSAEERVRGSTSLQGSLFVQKT